MIKSLVQYSIDAFIDSYKQQLPLEVRKMIVSGVANLEYSLAICDGHYADLMNYLLNNKIYVAIRETNHVHECFRKRCKISAAPGLTYLGKQVYYCTSGKSHLIARGDGYYELYFNMGNNNYKTLIETYEDVDIIVINGIPGEHILQLIKLGYVRGVLDTE